MKQTRTVTLDNLAIYDDFVFIDNSFFLAVQHERAPRSSHLQYGIGRIRSSSLHGTSSLFGGLPLPPPQTPQLIDTHHGLSASSTPTYGLHHGFIYPSMLASFVRPAVLMAGLRK